MGKNNRGVASSKKAGRSLAQGHGRNTHNAVDNFTPTKRIGESRTLERGPKAQWGQTSKVYTRAINQQGWRNKTTNARNLRPAHIDREKRIELRKMRNGGKEINISENNANAKLPGQDARHGAQEN